MGKASSLKRKRKETQAARLAGVTDTLARTFTPVAPAERSRTEVEYTPAYHALEMGLRHHKYIGRKGDLVVYITQAWFDDYATEVPCMVIGNRHNPRERHVFVPLQQLWMMVDRKIGPSMAASFCVRLFGVLTKSGIFNVLDVFNDFADDLKNALPPRVMGSRDFLRVTAADGFVFKVDGQAVNG